jgi:hypothetical protein
MFRLVARQREEVVLPTRARHFMPTMASADTFDALLMLSNKQDELRMIW